MVPKPAVSKPPVGDGQMPGRGMAIASLVLGILSLVCCGLLPGILAVIFGCVAQYKGNTSHMATAGIVCGIIGSLLALIVLSVIALAA